MTHYTSEDLTELMRWLENHQAKLWDNQIEEDLEAGRLDPVLAKVDEEFSATIQPFQTA